MQQEICGRQSVPSSPAGDESPCRRFRFCLRLSCLPAVKEPECVNEPAPSCPITAGSSRVRYNQTVTDGHPKGPKKHKLVLKTPHNIDT